MIGRRPCDQDMLRKYVKDVTAERWQAWFNGAVQGRLSSSTGSLTGGPGVCRGWQAICSSRTNPAMTGPGPVLGV